MKTWVHTSCPSRVIFGVGTADLPKDEVERLGCKRVLLLPTPAVAQAAARVRGTLGDRRRARPGLASRTRHG